MSLGTAAMMGTCGTLWPGWWRDPHPDPDPWWWVIRVAGALGGIGATILFGAEVAAGGEILSLIVLPFFGGNFLGSVVEGVRGLTGGKRGAVAGS